ncbi:aminotransferase class V-fold PLP-dependent enzyme [Siccirubricoccus sp. KC 17139]|uniref:Aminotransferase class V-fold PLP-dependent enzyme n=1 Tax=Siccirubricoccus soli TaxID=2899147 RepID=A0ABT1DDL3_9PROT|nr:aminotransferase class V-fold PLP-dependent enzyme [Siccirubricoccus soli]MCO6420033.1 aminotransferase class V-fold PLP-dependent enzyme [Siccirubricoccus soli]MCP2686170.1 aminotransferase class V-fold PLP-dependent enzyme [Siccirubricoccus soli]
MLACQRDAFDIPRDVAYLNAASWSPLPKRVQEAGHRGVARKAQPWTLPADHYAGHFTRARRAAAALIGAAPEDIALIPSVGYGVSTAGKILPIAPGQRVLVLADDHSSPTLEWLQRAPEGGFAVETVARPGDGDWTAAVLEAIARPGAAPLALVSISSVHWADGGLVDLAAVSAAAKAQGAALLVDATHHAGVLPLDVRALDPDVLVFPTYKWVLGPYGRAFLYVAKRWQGGVPLEQTASGRRAVDAETAPYFADLAYAEGAQRFDMGERDHLISLEMASVGMEMMAEWGQAAIATRLAMLTERLAAGLEGMGLEIPAARVRAPHVLSLGFPGRMKEGLVAALAARRAYAAPRLGRLRISPHVYNDEADVDAFLAAFRAVV